MLAERFGYRRVVIAVALLSLTWRAASTHWLMYRADLMDGFFLGRWTEFTLGMLVAAWYNDERRRSEQVRTWIVVLTTSIAFSLIGSGIALNFLGDGLIFNQVIGAGFALFLVAVIRSSESNGTLGNLVSAKPLVWIGVMSYSVYLTHSLALGWVDRGYITWGIEGSWQTELLLFLGSATSVGVLGFAFYQVVERKFMRSVNTSKPKILPNTHWSATIVSV